MRRLLPALLVTGASLLIALLLAAAATADPGSLKPLDLRVAGGEDTWHADNDFRLDWDLPPAAAGVSLPGDFVGFRVRDAAGSVLPPEAQLPWETVQIENIHVPATPGIYTADVWLQRLGIQHGAEASATLRFDDRRPGPAQPRGPSGWIAGNAAAVVTIEHPAGPLPISGIRGYAVSVDRDAGGAPCAGQDRCSLAETDLRGGIGADSTSLGVLSEGVNFVHAVAVSGSGMRSAQTRSAIVHVDASRPEVALQGAPAAWADGPVRLRAVATDALSGMAANGPSGPYTAISIDGGLPRVDPGDSASALVAGEGSHRIAFYARDEAGNTGEESPSLATVGIDESPPRVAFADSQDRADPERIEARVSDPLSGPDPARGSIEVRPAGSRQPFAPLPTTVTAGRLLARWDSDSFPPGNYEFRATGYDAAGNVAGSDRRGNGARLVLANPLKTQTEIAAGFGGRRLVWQHCSRKGGRRHCRREEIESFAGRPTARVVPYRHGVPYAGRLTSAGGSPLGGLPVQVVETFAAGADSSQRTTTVQTGPDGAFLTRLAPGPSRRVEVAFAGNRTLTRAAGGEVQLRVLAGVRMRASSPAARVGGAPVIFSGQVGDLGAAIPAAGRPVELQFRFPGSGWSEFRTVQTDTRGRFRYAYSFSDDDSRGVRFQFRACAPAQDGWPYEPATSRPVFVTGR